MFKELIVTCLLVGACNSSSTKLNEPKNAGFVGNTYVLRGGYCFRDTFDYDLFFERADFTYSENIFLTISSSNDTPVRFTAIESGGNFLNTYLCDYIEINYNEEYGFSIEIIERGGLYFTTGNFDTGSVEDITDIYAEVLHNDFDNFTQNLVVTFPNEYYLNGNYAYLFDLFFTQSGNRYVSYYTGYYNFNNGNWFTSGFTFDYAFGCYYTAQSYIFNRLYFYNDLVEFQTSYADMSSQSYVTVYHSGTYTNLGNIYVTGLLPQSVRNRMNQVGQFAFASDTSHSDWYDMVLSTMDAPIYYIRQLLGFELFGINLFVAFSSLLTLVIVITIIKKVV